MRSKLSDICLIEKGKQIDTNLLDDSNPYKYINGGIKESGFYTDFNTNEPVVTVSEGGASCGYVGFVEEKFWCGCHCYKLSKCKVEPKYLYYALKSNQQKIMNLRTGATMPNIKKELFKQLEINVDIDKENQLHVINELDNIQNLINANLKKLESFDEIIKSRFIDMFEDKGFEEVILGDVIKTTSGGTPKSTNEAYYEGGSIPWLTSGEVNQGIIYGPKNFITQLGLDNSSAKLVPENCVVIAMYGATAGKVGLVKYKTTTNQAVCVLLPSKDFLPEYLMQACSNKEDWMISKTIGSGQPNISQLIIKRMPLIRAPINLQKEYVNFVNLIDKSKFVVQQQIKDLEELLDKKMDEYFGG
jgi:type I restriction enzyme S subunit